MQKLIEIEIHCESLEGKSLLHVGEAACYEGVLRFFLFLKLVKRNINSKTLT